MKQNNLKTERMYSYNSIISLTLLLTDSHILTKSKYNTSPTIRLNYTGFTRN